MGLTKQYRRFVASASFGVVGSAKGGLQVVPAIGKSGTSHRASTVSDFVAVAKAEDVVVWNLKAGEKVTELRGGKFEVTAMRTLQLGPNNQRMEDNGGHKLAVGYHDGAVMVFDLESGKVAFLIIDLRRVQYRQKVYP